MRYRLIGLVMAAFCLSRTVSAQDIPLALPDEWMDGNPTARSFGMGFSGMTADVGAPSLLNPASLGVWALTHSAYQMHNWEMGGPGGGIVYDFSNTVEAIGARWTPKNMERPPTVSFGLLYREGRYSAGPFKIISPNTLEEYYIRDARQSRDVSVGASLDAGVLLSMGARVFSDEEAEVIMYFPEYTGPQLIPRQGELIEGYQIQLRAFHFLQSWGFVSQTPSVEDVNFDVYVSQGGTIRTSGDMSGWALGFRSDYQGEPLLTCEYARDRDGSRRNFGWEIGMLGAVYVRRGDRDVYWPEGTFFDSEGNIVVAPDWTTVGYAFDFGNAQRWVRRALDIETSRTLGWILDHLDARYETASFRHPDQAPPGLGQVKVRQWTVGLRSL